MKNKKVQYLYFILLSKLYVTFNVFHDDIVVSCNPVT